MRCPSALAFLALLAAATIAAAAEPPPNIVYILADDLGYGDVGCYNPESKIRTPNLDRLAREGMRFTDVHSGSAVCTPTRYGILTGRYAWRTRLQESVLFGYSPPLIEPERMTVASLARDKGYATACIGKWHLGLGWVPEPGKNAGDGAVDYEKPVTHGPTDAGFDYFFGIPASLDMFPYVYIENQRVTMPPVEHSPGREGTAYWRAGPVAPGFDHEQVLPTLTQKAIEFINNQLKTDTNKPFLLYFPLPAPHTPVLPTPEFQGKSGIGPYGDFVVQCDWVVGEIMGTLERLGLADNTLLIFTSDNGCAPMADLEALAAHGHNPSQGLRGHKADIFEGGHRIPFIVRWPNRIKPKSTDNGVWCLSDFMATVADILDTPLPDGAGVDSVSMLPALLGDKVAAARPPVVHHSVEGAFAIREGDWKLILCKGSGGWSAPTRRDAASMDLPPVQLYNLAEDRMESRNLAEARPEKVAELLAKLDGIVQNGRSTPGPAQPNDIARVSMWGPGARNLPDNPPEWLADILP